MHINIKPASKNHIYETAEQAIQHLWIHGVYAQSWNMSRSFGQSIDQIRAINAAIKSKDYSAFKASKRRGYWMIELS